jgi:Tol biopolymer transport system component
MSSGAKSQLSSSLRPSPSEIRAELNKILASDVFIRSERLSGLLSYVVERTLEGNQHILKEQTIAQDFFGRGSDFEGAADPIVRVEARRLRDKLREYYADAASDSIIVGLPKGSYVPSFERNPATTPVIVPSPEKPEPIVLPRAKRIQWHRVSWAAAAMVVVAAILVWFASRRQVSTPLRVQMLTSLPGNELTPSLSPDGNYVVFGWSNGGPADLYIKETASGESLRRLTETPEHEFSPKWSRDGRAVAFSRARKGVFTISVIDGVERKIAESGGWLDWSADSNSVFIVDKCAGETNDPCIYTVLLDTLEKRQITKPDGGKSYYSFAASPDGRSLAVVRDGAISDVHLISLEGGEVRRLTNHNRHMQGVAWAPDGKSVFYCLLEGTRFRLWRTAANGTSGNGKPIAAVAENVRWPSVAQIKTTGELRVAYQSMIHDVSLRLIELNPTGPTDPVGAAMPFADATEGRDCGARFSPDATQVAFWSPRTGAGLLWLARRDGSHLHPLTSITAQEIRPGGWSPDGRQIVFEATLEGQADIYVTDNAGAKPIRLTSDPSYDLFPAWSRDGRWIYFTSDRSGSHQIWKLPAVGGAATQVTFQGGMQPRPSIDGEYIYYVAGVPFGARVPAILKRVPSAGGEESVVAQPITPFNWSVTSKGIYNVALEKDGHFLDVYDPSTAKRTRLGVLPFRVAVPQCGFTTVSEDARFLIANHLDRDESNLGLIDGFQ